MKFTLEHPKSSEAEPPVDQFDMETTLSPVEKQEYNRDRLTDILTKRNAHSEILGLAREGVLERILPEVAETWGVRHHVDPREPALEKFDFADYAAKFHKEGDVFRHTLNVVRAINLPAVQDLIKEIYPEMAQDDDIVESFFGKTGPELAWSLLLHDIGKKQTQASALTEDLKPVGHYSFPKHGERSADIFEKEIAPRLNFNPEQAKKISTLMDDHMLMHKLMRGKDTLSEQERETIMEHPEKEELLWHAFFDSIGNYTGGEGPQAATESKDRKIADFRAALEALQEYDHAKETEVA